MKSKLKKLAFLFFLVAFSFGLDSTAKHDANEVPHVNLFDLSRKIDSSVDDNYKSLICNDTFKIYVKTKSCRYDGDYFSFLNIGKDGCFNPGYLSNYLVSFRKIFI